jgi:hypothetical protein
MKFAQKSLLFLLIVLWITGCGGDGSDNGIKPETEPTSQLDGEQSPPTTNPNSTTLPQVTGGTTPSHWLEKWPWATRSRAVRLVRRLSFP